jgi:hypothetical protein
MAGYVYRPRSARATVVRSTAEKKARFRQRWAPLARAKATIDRGGSARQRTKLRPRDRRNPRRAARATAPIAARQNVNASGVSPAS